METGQKYKEEVMKLKQYMECKRDETTTDSGAAFDEMMKEALQENPMAVMKMMASAGLGTATATRETVTTTPQETRTPARKTSSSASRSASTTWP